MTISPEILQKIANLTAEQQADLENYLSKFTKIKESETKENPQKKVRQAGFFSGKIKMLEGFDDPIEDFKDYM